MVTIDPVERAITSDIPATADFDRRAIPDAAHEWRWRAPDGHEIRAIDWPQPEGKAAGALLFMAGRGDAYEKYLETFEHWRRRGWRVSAVDWRGQAGSGRLGLDEVTGHVEDFALWIEDLAHFWADWVARVGEAGPRVLVGHSMGGHLVLRAAAEATLRPAPDALILSAPMLDVQPGRVPLRARHWLAKAMVRIGDKRRMAWKWSEKPGVLPAARQMLLTHDDARYADEIWWRQERPELVMGPGSWGWVESALSSITRLGRPGVLEQLDLPVLALAARADRLVSMRAIEKAAARLPCAELLAFGPESRHEILRERDEVRDRALAAIDDFLARLTGNPPE